MVMMLSQIIAEQVKPYIKPATSLLRAIHSPRISGVTIYPITSKQQFFGHGRDATP